MFTDAELNIITRAYLDCAVFAESLWDTEDGEPIPFSDLGYIGADDFSPAAFMVALGDCEDFVNSNAELLQQSCLSLDQIGHDFWLTRNGHGAGFWDRGLGAIGSALSDASKVYGSAQMIGVSEDGELEFV